MTYFAVLRDGPTPKVIECHVNLWLLPAADGAPSRTFFDVGVSLEGKPGKHTFRLALPFRADSCASLHSAMRTSATATLVFGEKTRDGQYRNTVEIGSSHSGSKLRQKLILEPDCNRIDKFRVDGGDVWSISYTRGQPTNQVPDEIADSYVRLRFVIADDPVATIIQRYESGLTVDFRIADTRNIAMGHAWDDLALEIEPLPVANLFVIAPSMLQRVTHHPEFRYLRVLESRVWNDYLNSQPSEKMSVYYWRWKANSNPQPGEVPVPPISFDDPFRGFIAMTDPARLRQSENSARATFSGALATSAGTVAAVVGTVLSLSALFLFACVTRIATVAWSVATEIAPQLDVINNVAGAYVLAGGVISTCIFVWKWWRGRNK